MAAKTANKIQPLPPSPETARKQSQVMARGFPPSGQPRRYGICAIEKLHRSVIRAPYPQYLPRPFAHAHPKIGRHGNVIGPRWRCCSPHHGLSPGGQPSPKRQVTAPSNGVQAAHLVPCVQPRVQRGGVACMSVMYRNGETCQPPIMNFLRFLRTMVAVGCATVVLACSSRRVAAVMVWLLRSSGASQAGTASQSVTL